MIGKFLQVACAAVVFGASTTLAAVAVAIAGLWLIGQAAGDPGISTQLARDLGSD